jgi:hypothetical protein
MISRLRNPVFAAVVAGVMAMAGGTMSTALAQMPQPKVSQENAKAMQEVQAAAKAKNWGETVSKARAILAKPGPSPRTPSCCRPRRPATTTPA